MSRCIKSLPFSTACLGALLVLMIGLLTSCSAGQTFDNNASENASGEQTASEQAASVSVDEYYDMEFHRGGRDARPENTLYAFQYALEAGASTIECDMQLTRDNEIVLSHNPVLNPDITTTSDSQRVKTEAGKDASY